MSAKPRFVLAPLQGITRFAPLVAFGFMCRDHDLWSPIISQIRFPPHMHTDHPMDALLTLWVSILAGCRSVSQINTVIRPDLVLAQAWKQTCFAEQSTVARVLDQFPAESAEQLRSGVESTSAWMGQAVHHDWVDPLLIDIDLTPLPASHRAEGSSKGYFSEKKAATDGNCVGSAPLSIMKWSVPCSILATH